MIEIQLIFRPSVVEYKPGVLIYRLIHNRVVRQYLTDYRIFPSEWNEDSCCIELYNPVCNRSDYLLDVTQKINIDINNLKLITKEVCDNNCNNGGKVIDQVLSIFKDRKKEPIMMFEYMYMVIENVRKMGHIRLSETYLSTLNSLKRFSNGVDFKIEQLDSDLVSAYEVYLKKKNLSSNTTSFYMRNLRSIYNRAVASGLVHQINPFRYVYSGVAKTAKRNNIPISVISEGMGHTSESVTRIYLSQIEGTNVDKANQFIINLIG